MTTRMTKEAEDRIVRGVEQVVDLVTAGHAPNDALVKVARDSEYTPGHVRLMVQAYNTGRTNYQRKSHSDLFDKTASFPLADAAVVLEALYPTTVKTAAAMARQTAVSDDYLTPPEPPRRAGLEKVAIEGPKARPYPGDPGRHAKKAFSLLHELETEREQRRGALAHARDKFAAAVEDLDRYFCTSGGHPFGEVVFNSNLLWGRPAKAILEKVAEANPRLAREKEWAKVAGLVDRARPPYSLVERCLTLAGEYGRLNCERKEFEKAAVAAASRLLGEFLPPVVEPPRFLTGSIMGKTALFGNILSVGPTVLAADTTRSIMNKVRPQGEDKLKEKALLDLQDPSHEARLRRIRTQAILHSLMANDEFISAEHPEKVTNLYNQISQLTPRAAEQPILMQALLRRYLAQGQADPHDLDQLVGIETKLKQRDEPSDDLPNVPGVPSYAVRKPKEEKYE